MRLYFFSQLGGALSRRVWKAVQAPPAETSPIDHPAIAAMSLIELADLPLGPDRGAPRAACLEREAQASNARCESF